MGIFTKDREPENFQEAVKLIMSPPVKYKNDLSYRLKRGRQAFDFGCKLADEGKLAGIEAAMWMRCGTMVSSMYRRGEGTPVNEKESSDCLAVLIKKGGALANENKISMDDYVILVQCWEQRADDLMAGYGGKTDYSMARSLYQMVEVNVHLFDKAEEYGRKIKEKYKLARKKELESII